MLKHSLRSLSIVAGLTLAALPAFSQGVPFEDGLGTAKFHKQLGQGPASAPASDALAVSGLSYVSISLLSLDQPLPFQFVGTDPGAGAATTVIPTILVPLRFVFPNTGNPVLDGSNIVAATLNSPMFQSTDYTTGGTDLGVTQYGDAIMRAEFWNYPGFSQSGYHVLLGPPSIAPTVTVNLPATGCGPQKTSTCGTAAINSRGALVGRVDITFFQNLLNTLRTSYTADQMPMFLTDNAFLFENGNPNNCCVLGYHDSESGPPATAATWIYSAYTEPNTFVGNSILDVQALSHEVSEWLNDPFVGSFSLGALNFAAPYVQPGSGGACIINFETGDVLEAPPIVFTKTLNGTTYHLQDEAFVPYFLHQPSFSVNGWYTYLNTFPTVSTLCGPG